MRGRLRFAWGLGVILLLSAAGASCARREPERPNLIVVLTDDQGYADLGVQGVVKDVKTPHLDALAADGVRFTRGYVTAPQCVPSRAGFLTGRQQTRFGVDTNRSGALPLTEKTLADRLRAAGYLTGMVGKWHLDGGRGGSTRPAGAASMNTSTDRAAPTRRTSIWRVTACRIRPRPSAMNAIGSTSRRTPRSRSSSGGFDPRQPFFLYLAYFAPHVPLDRPEPYLSRFGDVTDETRRMGLASIAAIDDGVGRIRSFLREHGIEESTLLFVLSDNGAPIRRESWNGSLNEPLVGEKGMLTDGGIRVPFVAAWKGVLPRGKVEQRAVSSLDVAATALALAGEEPAPELDGVNLLPFLTGRNAAAPHEFLYWRWRSQAAIFDGRWKLVFLPPDRWLLFDHSANAPETDDVAVRHPEVVARLRTRLEAWACRAAAAGPAAGARETRPALVRRAPEPVRRRRSPLGADPSQHDIATRSATLVATRLSHPGAAARAPPCARADPVDFARTCRPCAARSTAGTSLALLDDRERSQGRHGRASVSIGCDDRGTSTPRREQPHGENSHAAKQRERLGEDQAGRRDAADDRREVEPRVQADAERDRAAGQHQRAEREPDQTGREHGPGLEVGQGEEQARDRDGEGRAGPGAQCEQQALAIEQLLEDGREAERPRRAAADRPAAAGAARDAARARVRERRSSGIQTG